MAPVVRMRKKRSEWDEVRYTIRLMEMKLNRASDEREPFWRWFFD